MSRTITITAGRQNRQGDERDFSGPDGTYPVVLIAISDEVTEKSKGFNAKSDTWTYRVWTIAMDSGPHEGEVMDVRASSTSTGPKSKQFELISAFAGKTPPTGTTVDIDKLIGRRALAKILTNDNDYPYVASIMALPQTSAPAPVPVAAPAAVQQDESLPF